MTYDMQTEKLVKAIHSINAAMRDIGDIYSSASPYTVVTGLDDRLGHILDELQDIHDEIWKEYRRYNRRME